MPAEPAHERQPAAWPRPECAAGGWAVLSQALAAEHHLHVGQAFTLPSPRPTHLRVAALTTNLGWPPGAIILSSGDYARAWASSDPSAYEIQTTPGASVATVRNRVQRSLESERGPDGGNLSRTRAAPLRARGSGPLAADADQAARADRRDPRGGGRDGRDDLAAPRPDRVHEVPWFRKACCGAGCCARARCCSQPAARSARVFGLYAQLLGSHFLASVTGFPIVFNIEGVAALSSFALVSVIAVAMLAVPGYLVVRVPPGPSARRTSTRLAPAHAEAYADPAPLSARQLRALLARCDAGAGLGAARRRPRGASLAGARRRDPRRADPRGRAERARAQARAHRRRRAVLDPAARPQSEPPAPARRLPDHLGLPRQRQRARRRRRARQTAASCTSR